MQSNSQKSIEVLNNLIEINICRAEGYDHAAKETEGPTMKCLFSRLKETSYRCKQQLSTEVRKLGGIPKEGKGTTGKIYRAWMDVESALNNKNLKAIFNSCEFWEDIAVKVYEDVLDRTEYTENYHREVIKQQYNMIKADHDKIKNLRKAFLKV